MPLMIEHIDAIARKKGRDVLYLEFFPLPGAASSHYQSSLSRGEIIRWLDENAFSWEPCGDWASETTFCAYAGQLYIDVPFDEDHPRYGKLEAFLEYPDGTMRFDGARFFVLSLEYAMRNRHHDEPGFWDSIADKF
ncbi:hypothetical protein VOI32_03085 [Paraburkholderia caribensis]|uniref:Uncharacterized protein n=1 Tax=Paraburkholderia caribensis TaxID=75105 RepID=A0A9Q6S690_9BURK|nr:hypothetical protein [Paraburkholderia caribensis]MCO4882983.1 hypothetical protein [Paraburkholderia caribensis]PTB30673.1 hypothetical protein C9I56_00160 [Paraburkholderia caribensis]QLB65575.1 hypothetical protein A9O66_24685 [Paraburkholderia caribensis]